MRSICGGCEQDRRRWRSLRPNRRGSNRRDFGADNYETVAGEFVGGQRRGVIELRGFVPSRCHPSRRLGTKRRKKARPSPCCYRAGEAHMPRIATLLALTALMGAAPLEAQPRRGRYGDSSQGIPPGHLPPPGECRVWYDDRPAGHQPPPASCREAERVAARDRDARVIYGTDRGPRSRDDGWWGRDENRRNRPRAIPRYPYPDREPYPRSRYPYPDRYPGERPGYGYEGVPFDNGYRDGYDKGREDARDNDAYDPRRHSRYRSGDHGYDRRYG